MTAKQNRTTKTANTGKATTAERAAGKKAPEIRSEIQKEITNLRKAATTLSNAVYRAAVKAREVEATGEEIKALVREIPKQRRSDFNRIVGAPAEHVEGMPTNLAKGARYLALRAEEYDHKTALDITEGRQKKDKGRQTRPEEQNGVKGATPAAEGGADTGGEPGAVAAGKVADKATGTAEAAPGSGLADIQQGLEKLKAYYAKDPTISKGIRAIEHAAGQIGEHLAKLEANKSAKKGKKAA